MPLGIINISQTIISDQSEFRKNEEEKRMQERKERIDKWKKDLSFD